jgi:hypothetical protein
VLDSRPVIGCCRVRLPPRDNKPFMGAWTVVSTLLSWLLPEVVASVWCLSSVIALLSSTLATWSRTMVVASMSLFNFKESLLVYGCHPILPVARLLDVSHLAAHDVRMLLTSCFPSLFGLGAVATHELFRGLLARGFLALWVIDYVLFPYQLVAPFRWLAIPVGLCFEIPSFGRDVR